MTELISVSSTPTRDPSRPRQARGPAGATQRIASRTRVPLFCSRISLPASSRRRFDATSLVPCGAGGRGVSGSNAAVTPCIASSDIATAISAVRDEVLRVEHGENAHRSHRGRPVVEREPFLGFQFERLHAAVRKGLRGGHAFALIVTVAKAEQGDAEVRKAGQRSPLAPTDP